jgi:glutathione peroxidase
MKVFVALAACCAAACFTAAHAEEKDVSEKHPESVLDFSMTAIEGEDVALRTFEGKVLLLVNVASKCGLTPQYEELTALHEKYREQGFEVLGFPANNFMGQEPGTDEEILLFCREEYNVEFPLFSKISVKGEDQHPLYGFLTSEGTNPNHPGEIGWNFEKFLVDRSGKVVGRFDPRTKPSDKKVIAAIEEALAADEA